MFPLRARYLCSIYGRQKSGFRYRVQRATKSYLNGNRFSLKKKNYRWKRMKARLPCIKTGETIPISSPDWELGRRDSPIARTIVTRPQKKSRVGLITQWRCPNMRLTLQRSKKRAGHEHNYRPYTIMVS